MIILNNLTFLVDPPFLTFAFLISFLTALFAALYLSMSSSLSFLFPFNFLLLSHLYHISAVIHGFFAVFFLPMVVAAAWFMTSLNWSVCSFTSLTSNSGANLPPICA